MTQHTLAGVKKIWLEEPQAPFTRPSWGACKTIRMAKESDYEFINYDINGTIVEDCPLRKCDCTISIWASTPGDFEAKDYIRA